MHSEWFFVPMRATQSHVHSHTHIRATNLIVLSSRPSFGTGNVSGKNEAGSKITYDCNEGYQLVGVATRTCLDGQWTGTCPGSSLAGIHGSLFPCYHHYVVSAHVREREVSRLYLDLSLRLLPQPVSYTHLTLPTIA